MFTASAPPNLDLLFVARSTLPQPVSLGVHPDGELRIVPITAGSRFEGPRMAGRILDGACDLQRVREDGVLEIDATGTLQTDDGVQILYRNRGIRVFEEGAGSPPYSWAIPSFSAPVDSPYAWLNRALFVSRPDRDSDGVLLTVWQIS